MKTSDVYPAAASLVRAMLKVMIDTRSTSADDLRQRADWAYGAEKIAASLGDQDAVDLLRTNGELLRDLASRSANLLRPTTTTSTILPVARKMAASLLADAIARRAFDPEHLHHAGTMAFGASSLAERLEDQEATDFLRDLNRDLSRLCLLSSLSEDWDADIGPELGALLDRISGNGQEVSP